MEDTGRIRLIIIGIILAIVAGGYFLFTQANRVFKARTQGNQQAITVASSSPSGYNIVVVTPSPSSAAFVAASPAVAGRSANSSVSNTTNTTKGGTLPKTGFPATLFGIFGASAVISGFFLRKYPK